MNTLGSIQGNFGALIVATVPVFLASLSVPRAEGEPIGAARSGWLRATQSSALICTIALLVGFAAEAAGHGLGSALLMYGRWAALSLALLYLLFRNRRNSLAFALGLGAATAFIALLALVTTELAHRNDVLRHALFILAFFSGVLPPFAGMMHEGSPHLATVGVLLLWLFSISSATLGISSIVAFLKMPREANGAGKLRFAFWAGIFSAPAVWLIFILLWLLLIGTFHM